MFGHDWDERMFILGSLNCVTAEPAQMVDYG